ncbi:MAG: oligosaccharide flippase family protein [Natronomonas sp.]
MRLGQTSVVYLVSKIVASGLGFLATIYFTRLLGEEVYGAYALTLAVVSWLGIVKSVGFGTAVVKRMSEAEEPDAYLAAGTAIKTGLVFAVVVGVLVFEDALNSYVGRPVAGFVVVLLVVSIFGDLVSAALKGSHRVHIYAPLSTFRQGARSLCMVALVFLGWGLTGMLAGYAVGTAVAAAIGLLIVRPTIVVPRWRHVAGLFDFAKFAWIGNLRKRTFSDADILVLGLFVPVGLTGVYAVAYALSEFLDLFGRAIRETLFPEMSRFSAQDDTEAVAALTDDALAFAGLFLIPGVVGGALLGDRLMAVYGPGFAIGDRVLGILLFGLLVYSYTKQLLNTLNAVDRPDLSFRANGLFVSSNVVLNVVLVVSIGWIGAAIATAISAVVGLVASLYYARRLLPVEVPYGEIGRQWGAALGMGAVVYAARVAVETTVPWIDSYNAAFVLCLVGLGAAVYFLLLSLLSERFRSTVLANLPFDPPTRL